jgi:hypothetical protein
MTNFQNEAPKVAVAGVAGAAAGAGLIKVIGGIGVTALGTGVGITLLPAAAIGAGLSALGYGLYRLGQSTRK